MYTFIIGLLLLLSGFLFYSKYVEKQFGADFPKETPAYSMQDGVDYVPMPTWKVFLIQLLNIAGLGPIFGALQGALFGPVAFLWVIAGCVLGGAVHDYLSGMISLRHNGASLSEIHGMYLGKKVQSMMRVVTVFFCIIVGVVFVTGPADLLAQLTPEHLDRNFWIAAIFIYYFLATVLPIDVIIGKIYPLFGICLLIMAVGVSGGIILKGYHIPEVSFSNLHPNNTPMWPMMFVTIACGAISGFHATQSPMMARCLKSEKYARHSFYGAMIVEGVIALIWIAAGLAFYNGVPGLGKVVLGKSGASGAVFEITRTLLGPVGSVLAILGVVACPITTGDTAFRSARLALGDIIHFPQDKIKNRLILAVPMFAVSIFLTFVQFPILWRYMGWLTQAFAMVTLWACSVYLVKSNKNHWISTIPAIFMTAVCISYIMQAPEGFRINGLVSNVVGLLAAAITFGVFLYRTKRRDTQAVPAYDK
ncbi:MAG: carbon starvation protein A [Clostridium thermopalmarium]|uniref:carbon starvation CstA family protein n=1 Tax=Clostridium thermopalmarium TaxID=29373 RepID=UPI00235784DF|nr:carbon starvation CstA family protein [Clostridium thermopalmarium]MBE6043873.1 carbon starvation protein A [Clostridium thermopalmarium]